MRYDLHVHTDASPCSGMRPAELLEAAHRRGLDGIAVTDHNTIRGALRVAKLNRRKGFEVIIGEEVSTEHGEVLVFYVRKQIQPGPLPSVLEQARRQGAVVALAHPRDWLRHHFSRKRVKESRAALDALETVNGRTLNPLAIWEASRLASELGLAAIAGSDAHFPYEVGRVTTRFSGTLRQALKTQKTAASGLSFYGPLGIAHTVWHKYCARMTG